MFIAAVSTDTVRETAAFQSALAAVSKERRARVLSLFHTDDQRRSLCAGLALDVCLQQIGLREAETPQFRDERGKPRLRDLPQWQFSLAHSGVWGVCALADTAVGIDVEECRQRRFLSLAQRFFTAEEAAWLGALPLEKQGTAFYRLWTAKESLLKAKGCGLQGLSAAPLSVGDTLTPPPPWVLREYPLAGYRLTVCGVGGFPDSIIFSSFCNSALPR